MIFKSIDQKIKKFKKINSYLNKEYTQTEGISTLNLLRKIGWSHNKITERAEMKKFYIIKLIKTTNQIKKLWRCKILMARRDMYAIYREVREIHRLN